MSYTNPIAPQTAVDEDSVLVFEDKKLTLKKDASVKDMEGNDLFKFKGKLMTLTGYRTVHDADGVQVGQMKQKFLDIVRRSVYIGTNEDEKKVTVKVSDLKNVTNKNCGVYFGEEKVGNIEAGFLAKDITITIDDEVVASADRSIFKASALMLQADTFAVTVKANVDRAFIAMLVSAFNDIYTEQH